MYRGYLASKVELQFSSTPRTSQSSQDGGVILIGLKYDEHWIFAFFL